MELTIEFVESIDTREKLDALDHDVFMKVIEHPNFNPHDDPDLYSHGENDLEEEDQDEDE
jgi:hypothetical protein